MKDDGSLLALGAAAVLAVAGLVRKRNAGSRAARPKVLRLDDGRQIKVNRRLGKGMFSTAWLGVDGRAYLQSKDEGGDYAKEILDDIASGGDSSPYLPRVRTEGMTSDGRLYSMPRYKAPLRKGDSVKAWKQYRALERCREKAFNAAIRRTRARGGRLIHEGYAIMDATVDCAKADPDVPPGLVRALELLRDNAANYGADWTFEFSPRNLATTPKGQLVLLDVVFSLEAVERANAAARKRAQQRDRARRGWW